VHLFQLSSDYAVPLVSTVLHLQNEYQIDNFSELRHQAMVALAVIEPQLVIPYDIVCCLRHCFCAALVECSIAFYFFLTLRFVSFLDICVESFIL
jgi:hypothetical protein